MKRQPLEPFAKIAPRGPMVYLPGEPRLTTADNNAQYVDDQYNDFADELRHHISVLKQDLTETFPPTERVRLETLLGILRQAWEALRREA
jgi:hypothetical protein